MVRGNREGGHTPYSESALPVLLVAPEVLVPSAGPRLLPVAVTRPSQRWRLRWRRSWRLCEWEEVAASSLPKSACSQTAAWCVLQQAVVVARLPVEHLLPQPDEAGPHVLSSRVLVVVGQTRQIWWEP